ncbi:HeH/LEM domain-containing protein [Pseudomonas sp. NMI542_15]|uniref:HeH/LEM domain-containing protein n=1 Tax=Pseudomonas sp. NMI542_15 TaxID=2903148 RepID=UPI001E33BBE1|nr:HeH/LEM domain-containing protein [Pseudomonas sp. NMI542_15]MCE0778926.1 HeH/LEM domain-containing protein [Pseudomonas sp. NMI542_15]
MSKDDIKPGEQLTLAQINRLRKQAQSTAGSGNGGGGDGPRQDGPTVGEFVEAGYKAADYPPEGYASQSSQEEIDAAIAAQREGGSSTETDPHKMNVPELKEWLTAKGINFDASAKKPDLQALIPQE